MAEDENFLDNLPEGWKRKQIEGEISEKGIEKGELPSELTEETTGEIPEAMPHSVMMKLPPETAISQMISNMGNGFFTNLEISEKLENLIAKHKHINRIRMGKERLRKEEEEKRKSNGGNIKFI